jgi:hypothetical protein
MNGARAFGVAYRVDDFKVGRYEHLGIDLEIASGESHHELPMPSAFIVDRTGMIRFAYRSPKITIPIDAPELLTAARKLSTGAHDSLRAGAAELPAAGGDSL